MNLEAFLKSKSGLLKFYIYDREEILKAVETCFVYAVPDDSMLESTKTVLCFISDVFSQSPRKFNEEDLNLFIKLLNFVLEGFLMFENCNKKYHGVVMKLCQLIQTQKSYDMKIQILRNCFPVMLQLCVKVSVSDKTKLKLFYVCSHLLHGLQKSVMLEILPKISETLYTISKELGSFGDYFLQARVMEVLLRFSVMSPEIKENIAKTLKEHGEQFLKLTFNDFLVNCRVLLNDINSTRCGEERVLSIACYKAFIGTQQILKPKIKNYDDLWIDLNFGTRSISFICDANSLWLQEHCENEIQCITVESQYVESYVFKRIYVQKFAMDMYNLKLKLLVPCLCKQFKYAEVESKAKYLSLFFEVSSVPCDIDLFILPKIFGSKANKTSCEKCEGMPNICPHLEISHTLTQANNEIHMLSLSITGETSNFMTNVSNSTISSDNNLAIQSSSSYFFPSELSSNLEENLAPFVKSNYSKKKLNITNNYENNLSVSDPTFNRLLMTTVPNCQIEEHN